MDRDNAAVSQHTKITPAMLQKLAADPAQFGPWVRAILADHIDEFDTLIQTRPELITTGQRMEFMQFLAKLGDAFPKALAGAALPGSGFSISINLPAPGQAPQPLQLVQEVKAEPPPVPEA